jgi:hypothetical protein
MVEVIPGEVNKRTPLSWQLRPTNPSVPVTPANIEQAQAQRIQARRVASADNCSPPAQDCSPKRREFG